jgi:hypothetical protein
MTHATPYAALCLLSPKDLKGASPLQISFLLYLLIRPLLRISSDMHICHKLDTSSKRFELLFSYFEPFYLEMRCSHIYCNNDERYLVYLSIVSIRGKSCWCKHEAIVGPSFSQTATCILMISLFFFTLILGSNRYSQAPT